MSSAIQKPLKRRIVLSTVSSDSHTWNLVFLQLLLEEQGYEVVNLGSCVPDALLVDAVRRHAPHAVVISSVNGHGHIDGARLIRAVRRDPDPAVSQVPVMIGGKLGIRGTANAALAQELTELGFTAVFTEGTSAADFGRALAELTAGAKEVAA